MNIVASLQVRMGSGRLPGKVLTELGPGTLLAMLIDRVSLARNLSDTIVACPSSEENDVIERFCIDRGIYCFRGSESDNLGRLCGALETRNADIGVVVYGDNPLIDPDIIDEHIELFLSTLSFDWVGNNLKTTFPSGMEVEVFRMATLKIVNSWNLPAEIREHATLAIRQHPEHFSLHNVEANGVRRRGDLALGVDQSEDLDLVRTVVDNFPGRTDFSLEEIIQFLDLNPNVAQKNRNVFRRWRRYRKDF